MNTIIGTWIKNNVFKKEQRYDGKLRKQRLFYVCSGSAPSGTASPVGLEEEEAEEEQDI
jgi:hypothetical protein